MATTYILGPFPLDGSNRIHLAPSSWCTFQATGFVVITFVPQIAAADLNAEELPSYHRNVDNDESVFVHHDEAGARKPGMLVHTPQGILHGADEAARDLPEGACRGCGGRSAASASTRTGRWCRPRRMSG